MRNITFSAEPKLIEMARVRARLNNTTLNEEFRSWLAEYAKPLQTEEEVKKFFSQFRSFEAGKMPTRDELNER